MKQQEEVLQDKLTILMSDHIKLYGGTPADFWETIGDISFNKLKELIESGRL